MLPHPGDQVQRVEYYLLVRTSRYSALWRTTFRLSPGFAFIFQGVERWKAAWRTSAPFLNVFVVARASEICEG